MVRLAHAIKLYLLVGMILCACGRSAIVTPSALETTDDFLVALEGAGASVADTAVLGLPCFGVTGRVFQVNEALVQVYEYESEAKREQVSATISSDGSTIQGLPVVWPDRPNIWAVGQLIVVYSGTGGGIILLLDGLLGDPITDIGSSIDEPYPPGVTAAIQLLAEELAVDPSEVVVAHFEAVDWSDACLGLAEPGEICAEVITPGWRVLLRVDQMEFELHTDDLGESVRIK
jgi:hypothetical protein